VHIMSKKILKRSLALGALMAFVITGSAWAEEYITERESISTAKTPDNVLPYKVISSDKQGGAFYINSTGVLTLNTKKFEECVAIDGGAIANVGGTLNMVGCDFEKNSPTKSGSSKYQGAAVFNSDGIGEWNSCTFDNNSGSPAVWVTGSSSNVTIVNNKFINNRYGGIQIDAGKITITGKDNKFENNSVKGGIYVSATGVVNFDTDSVTTMSRNNVDIYTKGTTKVNIGSKAKVTSESGILSYGSEFNINEGTLEVGANSTIANLGGDGGTIRYLKDIDLTVTNNTATNLKLEASGEANDAVGGKVSELIGEKFGANEDENVEESKRVVILTMDEGDATGRVTAKLVNKGGYLQVESQTEETNTKNQAIGEAGVALKLHHRAHMNDMNKRMGELRNVNGEHGVWVRMVRGESEYENTKAQYNQYQLGYDEKLSVDKRWTVGAAVTFAEGDANYGKGTTDDKSTAFAIYGSKLNNDGTFVDLIARYAHLESDLDDVHSGKGDYSTNGMSVSAEFGKRIQQGNGLWIEPQVELTYGTVDSADFKLGTKTVHVGEMDSLIARAGFSLGKDIKQGNVYARASYLYDFDGETVNAFTASGTVRPIEEDLGGGWWEVGVGANINLSKATYIYADVEKTFGGEVDTNWQWNLGVRYSF